jgi:hypothetical protein
MRKSKEEWAKIRSEMSGELEEVLEQLRNKIAALELAANEMGKAGLDLREVVREGQPKSDE